MFIHTFDPVSTLPLTLRMKPETNARPPGHDWNSSGRDNELRGHIPEYLLEALARDREAEDQKRRKVSAQRAKEQAEIDGIEETLRQIQEQTELNERLTQQLAKANQDLEDAKRTVAERSASRTRLDMELGQKREESNRLQEALEMEQTEVARLEKEVDGLEKQEAAQLREQKELDQKVLEADATLAELQRSFAELTSELGNEQQKAQQAQQDLEDTQTRQAEFNRIRRSSRHSNGSRRSSLTEKSGGKGKAEISRSPSTLR